MPTNYQKQWDFLKKKFELDQMAHAYLFVGQKGIGKKDFAKEFAGFVGCKFPDLKIVEPEEMGEISIAKIREVQNFLSYKSYHGNFKAVIVNDSEKMNQEAQSCFLKTLEEPKGKTILFLISSRPDLLLPTIVSRCQTVKFFKPINFALSKEKAEQEQKIIEGLTSVLNLGLSERFRYVKSLDFDKQDPNEILEVLQKHFRKQLLDNFADQKAKKFLELSEEISQKLLFTNANPKLALEVLLLEL
jgi:DNA polymerase-3 subunit delta'